VRRSAAIALGNIGGEVCAAQAECLFVSTLQEKDKQARLASAASLTKLGGLYTQQIAEALAMALEGRDEEDATKLAAVQALQSQGHYASDHATAVGTALLDVDEDVREIAALTLLSAEGEAAVSFRARLMKAALGDEMPHVQLAAIRVLEALSGRLTASEFAAELATSLESETVSVRWGALRALRALGPDAVAAYARELAFRMADDSFYVRTLATEMLHELGPRGAELSQPVLSKALNNLDQDVRRNAALALGKHGQVAAKYASAICTRMLGNRPGIKSDDPDADLSERLEVRTACMWALGQLGADAVMPLIRNLDDGLFHRNPSYRIVAVEAMANLGPRALQTRKDHLLVMESTDRDDDVREVVAKALKQLMP